MKICPVCGGRLVGVKDTYRVRCEDCGEEFRDYAFEELLDLLGL